MPAIQINEQDAEKPKKRGPKTPEGKARAAMNAVKHGLRARRFMLLPEENPVDYTAHVEAMAELYRPDDAFERHCVETITIAIWREMRADRLESEVMADIPPHQESRGSGTDLIDKPEHRASVTTALRYRSQAQMELKRALSMLDAHRKTKRTAASQNCTNEFPSTETEPEEASPSNNHDDPAPRGELENDASSPSTTSSEPFCTNEFLPARATPPLGVEPRHPWVYRSADPIDPDIVLPVEGLHPSGWPFHQHLADLSPGARQRAFRRLEGVAASYWYLGERALEFDTGKATP